MRHLTTPEEVRGYIKPLKMQGKRIALVPTMGALHAGHMALVQSAHQQADQVIVSIFVNPTQLGEGEDFDAYPRVLDADMAACERAGVVAVYAPTAAKMYPDAFATTIHVKGVSEGLCGAKRPGHFDGVATVVAKLLLQTMPDIACFGEKDYQQLQVIRTLVRDLNIPVEIQGVPTMREPDGLALSSRNAYLSKAERAIAPQLHATLHAVAEHLKNAVEVEAALQAGVEHLLLSGFAKVDYLTLAHATTLHPLEHYSSRTPARLLVAAYVGTTRLIDNIAV